VAPDDPLRKEYPPLPEKPPPFDLDALRRIGPRPPRRLRWRRRKGGVPQLEDPAPKVTTARASVVLLALVPEPQQCAAIRTAVAEAGVPYAVPPRLTLRNGLSTQDEAVWREAVRGVTERWRPFTVRLLPPDVVDDRMVCLETVGDAVSDLQHALGSSLAAAGFLPMAGDVSEPVLLLAATFTGLTRSQLHELAGAVRDRVSFPMDFRARTLYAVAEAAGDDDLPVDAFPLAG
jgi:hypothetical protein